MHWILFLNFCRWFYCSAKVDCFYPKEIFLKVSQARNRISITWAFIRCVLSWSLFLVSKINSSKGGSSTNLDSQCCRSMVCIFFSFFLFYFCKGQDSKYFKYCRYMVPATMTQFFCCSMKAGIENT